MPSARFRKKPPSVISTVQTSSSLSVVRMPLTGATSTPARLKVLPSEFAADMALLTERLTNTTFAPSGSSVLRAYSLSFSAGFVSLTTVIRPSPARFLYCSPTLPPRESTM